MARETLGEPLPSHEKPAVTFLALQDLVYPLKGRGYDIRPVLHGDPLALLDHVKRCLAKRTSIAEPRLSGMTWEIGGREGMFFSVDWLRSAGIQLQKQENVFER